MEFVVQKAVGVKAVVTTSSTLTITVTHVPVPVISILPLAPSVADNTPSGTNIAKATVTNADGSPFTGTLVISAQKNANEFVLAREGTTNVWDINVGTMALGADTPTVTLTATE